MPKTFPQELAEWVKKRETIRARQDKNLVAFLALKSDVQAAMNAGYSLLTIWEHLHDQAKLPYRYETFLKHVRRHIKGCAPLADDPSSGNPPDPPRSPGLPRLPGSPGSLDNGKTAASRLLSPGKPAPPPRLAGFTFDAQPKKEDLL